MQLQVAERELYSLVIRSFANLARAQCACLVRITRLTSHPRLRYKTQVCRFNSVTMLHVGCAICQ